MKRKSKSPQITIGSVVVLKSGSLPMTVSQMDENEICADYWDGEKIHRYTGNRMMFKLTENTVSVQGAMKLVSQRRIQPVRHVSRSN